VRRYILFHEKHHPRKMGRLEIEAFLTHLAVQQQVAAALALYPCPMRLLVNIQTRFIGGN
jgi:hypothetical protein